MGGLMKRYTVELGEFSLWCAVANRAMELSGVPADEVEERVRAHWRPTTPNFRSSSPYTYTCTNSLAFTYTYTYTYTYLYLYLYLFYLYLYL